MESEFDRIAAINKDIQLDRKALAKAKKYLQQWKNNQSKQLSHNKLCVFRTEYRQSITQELGCTENDPAYLYPHQPHVQRQYCDKKSPDYKTNTNLKIERNYSTALPPHHDIDHTASPLGVVSCAFRQAPKSVLIIKRIRTPSCTSLAISLIQHMMSTYHVRIYVEPAALPDYQTEGINDVHTWEDNVANASQLSLFDFIISLGGDGTLLWVSQLFPHSCPPILGIDMGSLGYLPQFDVKEVYEALHNIMQDSFSICLRQRLAVTLLNEAGDVVNSFCGLNECVVDRGPSAYVVTLDIFCNDQYFTTSHADGIIVATPTGSTAYSMSAGGSMVHPDVPALLFTPICPHSLSFRPVVLPEFSIFKIKIAERSNSTAWCSVDGKNRTEIRKGMTVVISSAKYPFPMIVKNDAVKEDNWIRSLQKALNWNQKTFFRFDEPDHLAKQI